MADPEFQRQALEHLHPLYNLAVYLTRNGPQAEDLVQETYLRAFRFAHRFQLGTNLRAWMFQILRNTFLTFYRQREREPAFLDEGDLDTERETMFHDAHQKAGTALATGTDRGRALAGLPEQSRPVLILAEGEGLALEEVAEIMGCPLGTVKSRIF